jgi:hypothetical protein
MYMNIQVTFIDPHAPMNIHSWHQVTEHKNVVGAYNYFFKGIICI